MSGSSTRQLPSGHSEVTASTLPPRLPPSSLPLRDLLQSIGLDVEMPPTPPPTTALAPSPARTASPSSSSSSPSSSSISASCESTNSISGEGTNQETTSDAAAVAAAATAAAAAVAGPSPLRASDVASRSVEPVKRLHDALRHLDAVLLHPDLGSAFIADCEIVVSNAASTRPTKAVRQHRSERCQPTMLTLELESAFQSWLSDQAVVEADVWVTGGGGGRELSF
ncbi:unnamed protein product [Schistocephalus solidus]|uniref:Uncharacterized protein n=1 Tax=Schistocephalus solidus TaxID=70667 RepID=A0A183S8C9_SCHSO|nr:unnamed protein product [Schistocephalus solidus]